MNNLGAEDVRRVASFEGVLCASFVYIGEEFGWLGKNPCSHLILQTVFFKAVHFFLQSSTFNQECTMHNDTFVRHGQLSVSRPPPVGLF